MAKTYIGKICLPFNLIWYLYVLKHFKNYRESWGNHCKGLPSSVCQIQRTKKTRGGASSKKKGKGRGAQTKERGWREGKG